MIIQVKDEIVEQATSYSNAVYEYDRKESMKKPYCQKEDDHIGYIVEFHILDFLGMKLPSITNILDQNDLVFNDMKIDVKGTKYTNPHLIVRTAYTRKKDVTHYLLGRYDKKAKIITILGIIAKKEFLEKSVYNKTITPYIKSPILHWSKLYPFELPKQEEEPFEEVIDRLETKKISGSVNLRDLFK